MTIQINAPLDYSDPDAFFHESAEFSRIALILLDCGCTDDAMIAAARAELATAYAHRCFYQRAEKNTRAMLEVVEPTPIQIVEVHS
jgi:hypothetical protein